MRKVTVADLCDTLEALRSQIATLTKERDHFADGLRWIAEQPCHMCAEDASTDTTCDETGADATEWCLPCYARVTLAEAAQGETGCIQEALVRARAVLREVLDAPIMDEHDVREWLGADLRDRAEREVGR